MWNGSGRQVKQLRSPPSGCSEGLCWTDNTPRSKLISFVVPFSAPLLARHQSISITQTPTTRTCPPSPHLLKPSRVHGNRATDLHPMLINSWLTQSCKLCTEMSGMITARCRMTIPLLYVPQARPVLNIALLSQTACRHHQAESSRNVSVAKWPQTFFQVAIIIDPQGATGFC